MNVDIPTLFFGSGFALFLVLLAWGNKIIEPRQEISELEDEFVNAFKVSKRKFKPLVSKSYEKLSTSPLDGFLEQVNSMVDMMDKLKGPDDVEVIKKFQLLHHKRGELEKFYNSRYMLSLVLTFISFISGSLSIYNGSSSGVEVNGFFTMSFNLIYLIIFIGFVFSMLTIMTFIYFLEEKFIKLLDETDTLIGAE